MGMMNSLAVLRAAHIDSTLIRRAFVAVFLAGTLSGCWEATLSSTESMPAPEAASVPARGPCPSQDFPAFLDAFGESATVQRNFTRLPLEYGQLNAGLIGTPREDAAFVTRTINAFDAIPVYDRKDGGRVLRSKAKRRERGLKINVEPYGEDKNTKIATVFIPRTGFQLQFHFVNTETCWELVRIDDRSK
jgi:hypothetical protein